LQGTLYCDTKIRKIAFAFRLFFSRHLELCKLVNRVLFLLANYIVSAFDTFFQFILMKFFSTLFYFLLKNDYLFIYLWLDECIFSPLGPIHTQYFYTQYWDKRIKGYWDKKIFFYQNFFSPCELKIFIFGQFCSTDVYGY